MNINPRDLWRDIDNAVQHIDPNNYNNEKHKENLNSRNGTDYNKIYPDGQELLLADYLKDQGYKLKKVGMNEYKIDIEGNPFIGKSGRDFSSLTVGLQESHGGDHVESVWNHESMETVHTNLPGFNSFLIHEYNLANPTKKPKDPNVKEDRVWSNQARLKWINEYYEKHGNYNTSFKLEEGESASARIANSKDNSETNDFSHKHYEETWADFKLPVNEDNPAYKYLTESRGLPKNFVINLMERDLIRGYKPYLNKKGERIPSRVEFVHKAPKSRYDSINQKSFDPLYGQKNVGSDVIYFNDDLSNNSKIISQNSMTDYGFNFQTGTGKEKLFIFESPLDALSFISQNAHKLDASLKNASFVSASGSAGKTGIIENYQKVQYANRHTDFKKVFISFDNDRVGRKAALIATEEFIDKSRYVGEVKGKKGSMAENAYDTNTSFKVIMPSNHKDWNELQQGIAFKNEGTEHSVKNLNVDDFAKETMEYNLSKLSKDGKKALARIMNDYDEAVNHMYHGEKINPNTEPIKDIRKTRNNMKDSDEQIISNFMSFGGGSAISSSDLKRYANEILDEANGGAYIKQPKEREKIQSYQTADKSESKYLNALKSLKSDTSRQQLVILSRLLTFERQSNENKRTNESKITNSIVVDIREKVLDKANNNIRGSHDFKILNEYVNDVVKNVNSTNPKSDVKTGHKYLEENKIPRESVVKYMDRRQLKLIKEASEMATNNHENRNSNEETDLNRESKNKDRRIKLSEISNNRENPIDKNAKPKLDDVDPSGPDNKGPKGPTGPHR